MCCGQCRSSVYALSGLIYLLLKVRRVLSVNYAKDANNFEALQRHVPYACAFVLLGQVVSVAFGMNLSFLALLTHGLGSSGGPQSALTDFEALASSHNFLSGLSYKVIGVSVILSALGALV